MIAAGSAAPIDEARLERFRLRAMNSDIELVALRHPTLRLHRAARWLHLFERRCSRFLPGSELTALNASAGSPFVASPMLFALVSEALRAARASGGLFDPTVHNRLVDLGYDRSFELIAPHVDVSTPSAFRGAWSDIQTDARTRTITLPPGVRLDLGGIGKGWAADRVARFLGSPCLVNCGGDIRAMGRPSASETWRIGITDPLRPEVDVFVLSLVDAAVATSSTLRRSWGVHRALHHLIDPRTGMPSGSDAVQVTVVAPTATLADCYAKVVLLLGAEDGMRYLNGEPGVEGLAIASSGVLYQTLGFQQYVLA